MDCQFKQSFKPGEKESKKLESDETQNFSIDAYSETI